MRGIGPRSVPQVPQNKWFRESTKRAFTRWCQFLIKIWSKMTLSVFKKWWENLMKLRILVFMSNDFSDRFWQNHTFCCMTCTIFLKVSRSEEALEEPLQCTKCTLTWARSKIVKMHSLPVTTQKTSFWRQVLYENAIRVGHLKRWIFPSHTF